MNYGRLLIVCLSIAILGSLWKSAIADEQRTHRVLENPVQDGNFVLRINDGGTKQDAVTITGSTNQTTIGQATGGASPALTVRSDGSSTAAINRTTSVGALVGLEFQGGGTKSSRITSSSSNAFAIENQSGAEVILSTQAGSITVGPPSFSGTHFVNGTLKAASGAIYGEATTTGSINNSATASLFTPVAGTVHNVSCGASNSGAVDACGGVVTANSGAVGAGTFGTGCNVTVVGGEVRVQNTNANPRQFRCSWTRVY